MMAIATVTEKAFHGASLSLSLDRATGEELAHAR